MKTFKLKQKYPSLPSDWEVGMEVGQGDRGIYGDYSPIHGKYSNRYINMADVEANPEFWEELIEKDYDVLSYSVYNTELVTKRENGNYLGEKYELTYTNKGATWEEVLGFWDESIHKIHSVKYLPTGEVFTIGDKVTFYNRSTISTIKKFGLTYRRGCIVYRDNSECCWLLKNICKVKSILFQSFDGKDIYVGDVFYYIGDADNICETSCLFKGDEDFSKFKTFAKRENAEEYIKTYKNYKTADGQQIVEGQTFYVYDDKNFKYIKTSFGNFTADKWAGKRFKTKKEVEELIRLNKKRFSLADIDAVVKGKGCTTETLLNLIEYLEI
jgi:hypothetical protein